jgi:xanthine dehydrogenase accessory factor
MIGSRRKIKTVYDNLVAKGVSQEKLEAVHAPIGLDIGALTPEEIAVAILAEMIQERRKPKRGR